MGSKILKILIGAKQPGLKLEELCVGLGFYGYFVGLLAHFKINYYLTYFSLITAPVIIYLIINYRYFKLNIIIKEINYYLTKKEENNIDNFLINIVILLYLIFMLMPELGFDALVMHLFIPSIISSQHIWNFDPGLYVFSLWPLLGDWLFSLMYMLGGESSVRILNLVFLLIVLLVLDKYMLFFEVSNKSKNIIRLLILTSPLTFTETSSLFIDIILTIFLLFALLYLFKLIFEKENYKKNFYIFCILVGFSLGTKLTSLVLIPIFIGFSTLKFPNISKNKLIYTGILLIGIGTYPYFISYFISGNPFFPFYNDIFQSKFYSIDRFDNNLYHAKANLFILYDMTFKSGKYLESGIGEWFSVANIFPWNAALLYFLRQ